MWEAVERRVSLLSDRVGLLDAAFCSFRISKSKLRKIEKDHYFPHSVSSVSSIEPKLREIEWH